VKAGGILDATVRFERDRDISLHLARVKSNLPEDAHASLTPPDTIPRKAWLIPLSLFDGNNPSRRNSPTGDNNPTGGNNPLNANNLVGGSNPVVTGNVTAVTGCNRTPVTSSSDEFSRVSAPSDVLCNCVTEKIEIEIETKRAAQAESTVEFSREASENLGYTSYTVTEQAVTTIEQGLQAVTESPSLSVTKSVTRLQEISEPQGGGAASKSPQVPNNLCDNNQDLEEETEQPTFTFEEEVDAIAMVLGDGSIPDKEAFASVKKHHFLEVIRAALLLLTPERREEIETWLRELSLPKIRPVIKPKENLPPVAQIKIGSLVRYLGKGSERYGMVGAVKSLVDDVAKIRLDDHTSLADHLRDLEATLSQLELVE
jgi:hypothetical protein